MAWEGALALAAEYAAVSAFFLSPFLPPAHPPPAQLCPPSTEEGIGLDDRQHPF